MIVYRRKALIGSDVSHAEFVRLLDDALTQERNECFLLVRDDGVRLQVVADSRMLLFCVAWEANYCQVSYQSSYVDESKPFRGLSRICEARFENFVDTHLGKQAVATFFRGGGQHGIREFVDLKSGQPDREILEFPEPMAARKPIKRKSIELRAEVPDGLRNDMRSVCERLDQLASDPDEDVDFDDAIQIGSLCGGRVDSRADRYSFSYYLPSGDVWSFEAPRTILEGIADGSITRLKVTASVPK